MNVAVTDATAGSFVEVWPTGEIRPTASNVNFGPGQTIANLVTVEIGATGQVSFYNHVGTTHVIADVVGYFDSTSGSRFHPLSTPTRILDDRDDIGLLGPWGPAQSRSLLITGSTIPVGATGIVANMTVTGATAGSYITVHPNGTTLPNASTLNFGPGQTIANLSMTKLPANGTIDIYNHLGSVHIISDAAGYYAPV